MEMTQHQRYHYMNNIDKMGVYVNDDMLNAIDINILKNFNIFKKKPLQVGQHVEVWKPSSKHFGKEGLIYKKTIGGRVYIRTPSLEEFYCSPSSVRRTMNVQFLALSEIQDKLLENDELYNSYREFTEQLRKHKVDPREEGFVLTILSGMIV